MRKRGTERLSDPPEATQQGWWPGESGRPLGQVASVTPPALGQGPVLTEILPSLPGINKRGAKSCNAIRHFENTFVVETLICGVV